MSSNSRANFWRLKSKTIEFGACSKIMGIVNVTPDSFSDGGKFFDAQKAVEHALQLDAAGADILDIGGESTRPYSEPVDLQQELDRVIPVVELLTEKTSTPISIDTSKAAVAKAAIDAGAEIINDVTGLEGDPEMVSVAVQSGAGICAMHMQGTPQTMQDNPSYENVTEEIFDYLKQRRESLIELGIQVERICLDPGIGFGKSHDHNFELINNSERFLKLQCPILVGHSRKGFIGKALGDKSIDRDFGTLAISLMLSQMGIQIVRVHNVAATAQALQVLAACAKGSRVKTERF